VVAGALVFGMPAFGGAPIAVEREPVRVGVLAGPTAVAFASLIEDPPVLSDGRRVEIVIYPSPSVLIPRLIAGELDGATLPSNAGAQLFNRGVDIRVAATFIWGVLYLLGPREVDRIDQLVDLGVHSLGRGATPDLVLRYLLAAEGLQDAVEVIYGFDQVELAQLLVAGRISAAVLPEPFVTQVLRSTEDVHVVADLQQLFEERTGSGLPQTVLLVTPSAPAGELVDCLRESVAQVLSDPEDTASLVADMSIGLDRETTLLAIPRLNLRVESGRDSRDALDTYFGVLAAFEPQSIGGGLPAERFYGP
jgi:NitT/TauT family transport system substrate-binding protein